MNERLMHLKHSVGMYSRHTLSSIHTPKYRQLKRPRVKFSFKKIKNFFLSVRSVCSNSNRYTCKYKGNWTIYPYPSNQQQQKNPVVGSKSIRKIENGIKQKKISNFKSHSVFRLKWKWCFFLSSLCFVAPYRKQYIQMVGGGWYIIWYGDEEDPGKS